jgi:uncharacterized coiled-coil protein SlyX
MAASPTSAASVAAHFQRQMKEGMEEMLAGQLKDVMGAMADRDRLAAEATLEKDRHAAVAMAQRDRTAAVAAADAINSLRVDFEGKLAEQAKTMAEQAKTMAEQAKTMAEQAKTMAEQATEIRALRRDVDEEKGHTFDKYLPILVMSMATCVHNSYLTLGKKPLSKSPGAPEMKQSVEGLKTHKEAPLDTGSYPHP